MHLLPIPSDRSLRLLSLLIALVATVALVANGANAVESVKPWTAAPARPYVLRGADRRLLDRAEQFLADEQWDDALAALVRLLESDSTKLVAIDEHRYLSLPEYGQRLLMRLPETQLAQYRGLIDAAAESWYRRGLAERDDQWFKRIVDDYFCSTWADDALLAWGELALQRGDYQTARNAWLRLSPQLDPIAQRLTYPNTDLPLATIKSRLVLVSLREGDWQRAERELSELKESHPSAAGRLGGREVVIEDHLSGLLQQARTWPPLPKSTDTSTFAATRQRTNAHAAIHVDDSYELLWSRPVVANPLAIFPIVVDDLVVYQDGTTVCALNLADGEARFTAEGGALQSPVLQTNHLGQPRYTLTASGHQVFGTTTALLGPRRKPTDANSLCWSLDTKRDGALAFRLPSDDSSIAFAGAPLLVDTRFYLAIRTNAQTARAGIACYDLHTGQLRWRRWLCQANTPATGWTNEWVGNLLSYDAEMLYACTNLGAIAAVRADDGQVMWLRSYQRENAELTSEGKCEYYRGPNPCVCDRGRLFALPTDSNTLLALNAATGVQLWQASVTDPAARLIGVTDEHLVVANNGLQIYNPITGRLIATQDVAKLAGQPVLYGQSVVWPTDTSIQIFNLAEEPAEPKSVDLPQAGGANLTIAGQHLIASGPTQLSVFHIVP